MADKTFRSSLFKRIIDLGVVRQAEVDDLVRIWRVGTGDEKAITLENFVQTVNTDLGSDGFTLTEIIAIIEEEVESIAGNFVTLDTAQTITGAKTFNNEFLEIDGLNPVVRIKNTSNNSILNFRNIANEDEGGLELIGADGKLKLVTRVNNTDIQIEPHGTGSIILPNVASGTPVSSLGLDVNNKVVQENIDFNPIESVSGTAVDNTDPLNPIISVETWVFETLTDTITLNDTNGNVTYTCNSTIVICTNSKLRIKTLYLHIDNIASSGTPSGGRFEIKGYNFYQFLGSDRTVLAEVKAFRGSSYAESLLPLLRPDAIGTLDGQLIFRKMNDPTNQPPFTSTNGVITIKFAKFTQP